MENQFTVTVGKPYEYTGQTYETKDNPHDLKSGDTVTVIAFDGSQITVAPIKDPEAEIIINKADLEPLEP